MPESLMDSRLRGNDEPERLLLALVTPVKTGLALLALLAIRIPA